ncbi:prepilin-type N-terminal cleavage/methylation domain-containing protein [Thalassotalea ponticola]|uniref:prepilin-type N-terminal cleavage/methylation domain-containing protein n=1 Tax=Thalassotalea ponticola TaxID=1523392 RepID=UPI0025B2A9B2|nr:prepilin-type N-terminal cleavage/methylation domain-containing protein [Thalassotalea ponticola]MDN3651702.1 prepilin-type N-terminal cleavage/methylation domain-containing protein [Thalassotalea ponticola]
MIKAMVGDQKGYSLIELLIGLILLSIVMMGVLRVHLHSISLHQHHLASIKAHAFIANMLAYIRANPLHADKYTHSSTQAILNVDCQVSQCDPVDMAKYQLIDWQQDLARELPNAASVVSANANRIDVSVYWSYSQRLSSVNIASEPCPANNANYQCVHYTIE